MSFLEGIIIYLSVGAPFGVLIFFAQRPSTKTAILYSILATFGWPVIGTQRIYRSITRRRDRHRSAIGEASPLEILQDLIEETPVEPAELFEIAGHPNPWLATNCYTRSRKRVIESHIVRLESTPTPPPSSIATSPTLEQAATALTAIGS